MKSTRITAGIAAVAAGALVLTGCTGPSYSSPIVAGTEITLAYNQGFFHFNSGSSAGNNTANSNIKYMTDTGFAYYDSAPSLQRNTKFGTFDKTSDDPLTVEYKLNTSNPPLWSDSVPVDEADMLMSWAASHIGADGALVYPQFAAPAGESVSTTATIGEGTITLVYADTYPDWELGFGIGVSAHGTYALAYPDEYKAVQDAYDAAKAAGAGEDGKIDFSAYYEAAKEFAVDAKAKVIAAIQNNDSAVLTKLGEAWNSGYSYTTLPASPAAALTNGAYIIEDIVEGQYIRLTANPLFTGWGPEPKFEKITVRTLADSTAALQAIASGEVDIWTGQPTQDSLQIAQSIPNADLEQSVQAAYEHVDLTVNNGGPFDPAFWGGDEAKALKARTAFLKTIPRDEIIEKLIKPLNPNATPRDSFLTIPGAPAYDSIVEYSGIREAYGNMDIAGATALMAELGYSLENPLDVKFWWPTGNVRRQQMFELIQTSALQAGFNVIADDEPNWEFTDPSSVAITSHDAVTFAWSSTSLAVSGSDQIYASYDWNAPLTKGGNYTGYGNADVDGWLRQLNTEPDVAAQEELMRQIEKRLVDDAYGLTIFQFPGLVVWNKEKVSGVKDNPLSPNYMWNFWDWTPVQEAVPAQ